MGRVIIIGDVHGCLEELDELLGLLSVRPGADRLVFLGDLLDKGPDPVACVRRVRELGAECVGSNHDEKAVRWHRHEANRRETGKKNPMRDPGPERRARLDALTAGDVAWIASLPMTIDLGDGWHALHAGLEPCKTFEAQRHSPALLRTRYIHEDGSAMSLPEGQLEPDAPHTWHWAQRWRGPEKIIYGHHAENLINPRWNQWQTALGIDTGCVYGGRLTAAIFGVESGRVVFEHVSARRAYAEWHPPAAVTVVPGAGEPSKWATGRWKA